MANEPLPNAVDDSLIDTMQLLADYLMNDLDGIQSSRQLFELMKHSDPEIREAAMEIFNEINHLIDDLGKI